MKLVFVLDISNDFGEDYLNRMLSFTKNTQELFTNSSNPVNLKINGYGKEGDKFLLKNVVSKMFESYEVGSFAPTLGGLFENINMRTLRSGEKGMLVLFVSEKTLKNQKSANEMKARIESILQKGYKVVVIGSPPNFVEKEFNDLSLQVYTINTGPSQQPLENLPGLLDDVERMIGDAMSGIVCFLSVTKSQSNFYVDI